MKLRKLLYIGRHGLRAPLKIPREYEKDWPGLGMLTVKGAEMQYAKGKEISRQYLDFFSDFSPSSDNVWVSTSNLNRTIESACVLLNGVFNFPFICPSKSNKQDFINHLKHYGAHFKPLNIDVLYRGYFPHVSPRANQVYKSALAKNYEEKKHFEALSEVKRKIFHAWDLSHQQPIDYFDFYYFHDFLNSYHSSKLPFPQAFEDKAIFELLEFMPSFFLYDLTFSHSIVRKITNHYLYKSIVAQMEIRQEKQFCLYSTHDSNLFSLLLGMKYHPEKIPDFNAGLIIEIYEKEKNEFMVNLNYQQINLNRHLRSCSDSSFLTAKEFIDVLEQECFKSEQDYRSAAGKPTFSYKRDYEDVPDEIELVMSQEYQNLMKFKIS